MQRGTLLSLVLVLGCGGRGGSDSDAGSTTSDATTSATDETSGSSTTTAAGTDSATTTTSTTTSTTDATTTGTTSATTTTGTTGGVMCESPPPPPAFFWLPAMDNGVYKYDFATMDRVGVFKTSDNNDTNIGSLSVSMSGRVAVGMWSYDGIEFIEPYEADCVDQNGEPGIQTSRGFPFDLPYGTDDCVTNFPSDGARTYSTVAWAPSTVNQVTCEWDDEHLWIKHGGADQDVSLLNVNTGQVVGTASLAGEVDGTQSIAVDGGGHLWAFARVANDYGLVRVDRDTMGVRSWIWPEVEAFQFPAVDSDGYLWLTGSQFPNNSIWRFDPETETLDEIVASGIGRAAVAEAGATGLLWSGSVQLTGISRTAPFDTVVAPFGENGITALDWDGNLWLAKPVSGLRKYDLATMQVDSAASPPVFDDPRGDLTGYQIWHAGQRTPL